MKKFFINKNITRIKRYRKFENIANKESYIMKINYGYFYKSSTKSVCKRSRIRSLDDVRKKYLKLLKEGWKNTNIFKSYFLESI